MTKSIEEAEHEADAAREKVEHVAAELKERLTGPELSHEAARVARRTAGNALGAAQKSVGESLRRFFSRPAPIAVTGAAVIAIGVGAGFAVRARLRG